MLTKFVVLFHWGLHNYKNFKKHCQRLGINLLLHEANSKINKSK